MYPHTYTHVHGYPCIPTHVHICPCIPTYKDTRSTKGIMSIVPQKLHRSVHTHTQVHTQKQQKKKEMSIFKPSPGPLKQNVPFKIPRQFPGTFKLVRQFGPAPWAAGLCSNLLKILNLQILKAQPRDRQSEPRGTAGWNPASSGFDKISGDSHTAVVRKPPSRPTLSFSMSV